MAFSFSAIFGRYLPTLCGSLRPTQTKTRLSIFQQLLIRKHCVRSLSRKLGITESAISQHMKVLKEAGLVYGERYGYHIHYLPKQEALDELSKAFDLMKAQSLALCRDPQICQCEFREEGRK